MDDKFGPDFDQMLLPIDLQTEPSVTSTLNDTRSDSYLRWTGMFEYHPKRQSSRGKIFASIASPAEFQTELLVR